MITKILIKLITCHCYVYLDAKISQLQKKLRSSLRNSRYAGYPSYPIVMRYVPESQDKIGIHASNYYLRAKKDKEVLGLAKSGSDNDLEKLSTFMKPGNNVVVVDGNTEVPIYSYIIFL